jgi:hypothetical protein
MSNILKDAIENCRRNSKTTFHDLIPLLRSLSNTELVVFVHRKPFILGWPTFWQSELATSWLKELLVAGLGNELLMNYYEDEANSNIDITKQFWELFPEGVAYFFKLQRAFEMPAHRQALEKAIKRNDRQGINLLIETEFVIKNKKTWKSKREYYETIVKMYPIEELLMQITAYYVRFKRTSKSIENREQLMHDFRYNMVLIINRWLQIKKRQLAEKPELILTGYDPSTFISKWAEVAPPENPPGAILDHTLIPEEKKNDEMLLLRECIEFYLQQLRQEYWAEIYLSGQADFDLIDTEQGEAYLLTNTRKGLYDVNDRKGGRMEQFLIDEAARQAQEGHNDFGAFSKWMLEHYNSNNTSLAWWDFHCLPQAIIHKGRSIEMDKVLKLLITFSNNLVHPGRLIIPKDGQLIVQRKIPENPTFRRWFPTEDQIIFISREDMIKGIEGYFEWDRNEVEAIVDFLVLDLADTSVRNPDVIERPLIQTDQGLFWLGAFYKDMAWFNGQASHLKAEEVKEADGGEPYHNGQSRKLEKKIADWFKDAGFETVFSKRFKREDGTAGEIDVLAKRDNTLFLIELKNSLRTVQFLQSHKKDFQRYSMEASGQLSEIEAFIKEEPKRFSQVTGLKVDTQTEVIPLIASVNYDNDDTIHGNGILKLSVFELYIILTNQFEKMHQLADNIPAAVLDAFSNANHPNLNKSKLPEDIFKPLWAGELDAKKFYDIIRNDRVWAPLKAQWKFLPEQLALTEFDPNHHLMV